MKYSLSILSAEIFINKIHITGMKWVIVGETLWSEHYAVQNISSFQITDPWMAFSSGLAYESQLVTYWI